MLSQRLINDCWLTMIKEFTMTEGSSQYIATKTTPISSAIMTVTETCSLRGTTYASCTADVRITGGGKVTSSSTSSILTGTDVPTYYMFVHHSALVTNRANSTRYQIPVTGGAQILHATGNVCVTSGATRTTTPLVFGIAIGLFVFTAAIVL